MSKNQSKVSLVINSFFKQINSFSKSFFFELRVLMVGMIALSIFALFLSVTGIIDGRNSVTFIEEVLIFFITLVTMVLGFLVIFIIEIISIILFIVNIFFDFPINIHLLRSQAVDNLVSLKDTLLSIVISGVELGAKNFGIIQDTCDWVARKLGEC